jgi:uncharacterized protein (TIGR02145 family)
MKKAYCAVLFAIIISAPTFAQVGISDSTTFISDPSALLQMESQTKGLVIPRMTTVRQRNIDEPATGLVIFNLDSLEFYYFTGTTWRSVHDDDAICPRWDCGDPLVYDGYSYPTVVVDTQCWMAKNLNVGIRIDKTVTPSDDGVIEKYCFQDQESICDQFGGLYTFNEALSYSVLPGATGICPPGWHIPTDEEWKVLEGNVDSQYPVGDPEWNKISLRGYDAGKNLKSADRWVEGSNTDMYGFNALPVGYLAFGSYSSIGHYCVYRTSTISSETCGWVRIFAYYDGLIRQHNWQKTFGLSVRCLRDEHVNRPPDSPTSPFPVNGSANNLLNPELSWQCTDPDNDPLSFDIYFDTLNPPALRQQGLTNSTFEPGILEHGETYYWKVIANDEAPDMAEGPVWSFSTLPKAGSCPGLSVITYEGADYPTVQIGAQCWLAKNLDVGVKINTGTDMQNNDIIEKYCYNDDDAMCSLYGGLYQFNEALQYIITPGARGICPVGWHVPSDLEWIALEGFADSQYEPEDPIWYYPDWRGFDAGDNLKASSGWNGNNQYGFNALPGGAFTGGFSYLESHSFFWTSDNITFGAIARLLRGQDNLSGRLGEDDSYGLSIRCIKDE